MTDRCQNAQRVEIGFGVWQRERKRIREKDRSHFIYNRIAPHFLSRFRRPASIALLCQSLHSSPLRSFSSPESIAAVLLYLPMLLFREVGSTPVREFLLARRFFLRIFASSHLDNLRDE